MTTWVYDRTPAGEMHVVVVTPAAKPGQRFPVLVALHGRGEAAKGPAQGARGWVDDYGLLRAMDDVSSPPLRLRAFEGMADARRLSAMNESLSRDPFGGLIVVCPYTPDLLAGDRQLSAAEPLERFVVEDLLPRVRRETPAIGTAESTGIDGVSLGGRASILIGLARPESFGVVAALQPAFALGETAELTRRARDARAKNPSLVLRLLTSKKDFFLEETQALAAEWQRAGVPARLDVVVGDHSYAFNRGPGVREMLVLHDRALRGASPP